MRKRALFPLPCCLSCVVGSGKETELERHRQQKRQPCMSVYVASRLLALGRYNVTDTASCAPNTHPVHPNIYPRHCYHHENSTFTLTNQLPENEARIVDPRRTLNPFLPNTIIYVAVLLPLPIPHTPLTCYNPYVSYCIILEPSLRLSGNPRWFSEWVTKPLDNSIGQNISEDTGLLGATSFSRNVIPSNRRFAEMQFFGIVLSKKKLPKVIWPNRHMAESSN